MSNTLKMRNRETGFTLIELLTVIIIIGVLAAIAIPVFSAQRSRAQDSQTVSDVRNIVTAAETFLSDRTKSNADITSKSVLEYASSPNVQWEIKGNNVTNGYCIVAFNSSGKDYNSSSKLLSYDSTAGGLKGSNGSCGPKTGSDMAAGTARTDTGFTSVSTPASSTLGSTAVGSSTATPALPAGATAMAVGESMTLSAAGTGASGSLQNWIVPSTGTYRVETWGAQGGTSAGYSGGQGAYVNGTHSLTSATNVSVVVGKQGQNYAGNGTGSGYYSAGGGGGTFIYVDGQSQPLQVSGGGAGGSGGNGISGQNASGTSNAAGDGSGGIGTGGAGGGAGWYANGTNSDSNNSQSTWGRGGSTKNSWLGGRGGTWQESNSSGGFGGGGGSGGWYSGGGGGYTGGSSINTGTAAGGTSYISGSATNATSGVNNTGNGRVVITRLS